MKKLIDWTLEENRWKQAARLKAALRIDRLSEAGDTSERTVEGRPFEGFRLKLEAKKDTIMPVIEHPVCEADPWTSL